MNLWYDALKQMLGEKITSTKNPTNKEELKKLQEDTLKKIEKLCDDVNVKMSLNVNGENIFDNFKEAQSEAETFSEKTTDSSSVGKDDNDWEVSDDSMTFTSITSITTMNNLDSYMFICRENFENNVMKGIYSGMLFDSCVRALWDAEVVRFRNGSLGRKVDIVDEGGMVTWWIVAENGYVFTIDEDDEYNGFKTRVCFGDDGKCIIYTFRNDVSEEECKDWDIMEVYGELNNPYADFYDIESRTLMWKAPMEEKTPRKITREEIAKLLGEDFEIVE